MDVCSEVIFDFVGVLFVGLIMDVVVVKVVLVVCR